MDQASIPPGPPHRVTILHMYAIYSHTQNNTYTKMNLSTVKWAQWDKTQSRELLVLFICVCSSLYTIVAHNTAQNRPDNFPSCPPDNHHCSDDVYLTPSTPPTPAASTSATHLSSLADPENMLSGWQSISQKNGVLGGGLYPRPTSGRVWGRAVSSASGVRGKALASRRSADNVSWNIK